MSSEPIAPDDRPRVLVVDDERDVLDTLAATLEHAFDVETCTSPTVARKLLARERFDVVCTDFQMPTMTGIELVESALTPELMFGVVLLTGRADNAMTALQRSTALKGLPITLLRKPYAPEELFDAIRRANAFARVRRALRTLAKSGGEP
jgi:two-component system, OmpR family, response regulator VicR